ncbi:nitrate reductase delta subunit [Bradyrhizobium sp. JR6.1]
MFDRSKTLALNLFEHVHGESRDRGQAMVDLKAMYENAGLVIAANELPDYVPLLLEFLSTQPLSEARELLGQTAHILAALAERLGRRESNYKAVFDALVAIAVETPRRDIVDELLKTPDTDPMDLVALDAAWEEEEVRFGPGTQGQGACGHEGLIAKLRHARRAVNPVPSSPQ